MRDELEILFTNLSDFPGDEGLIELQRIIKDNLEEEEVFLPENCELAAKIIEELKIQSIQVKTTSKRTKKARQAIELDNFDFEDIEL